MQPAPRSAYPIPAGSGYPRRPLAPRPRRHGRRAPASGYRHRTRAAHRVSRPAPSEPRVDSTSRRRCQSPRRAEIIYRNVRDGRIISATTTLLATARPAQTIIITRDPNTKDLAIADRIAAEVVASTVVSSSRPASFIVFD